MLETMRDGTYPRYPYVPIIRLDRLAVDKPIQGHNLGSFMLLHAIKQINASQIDWAFFLVNARNTVEAKFYEKFYFTRLADNSWRLWLGQKQANRLAEMVDQS